MANTAPAAPNAAAPANGGKNGAAQAAPLLGYRGGTQPNVKSTGYSKTTTMTTSVIDLDDYEIAPTNLLRGIVIETVATAASNTASVAYHLDAPLNCYSTVSFADSGGTAIVGAFDSYTLSVVQKYGGYTRNSDPKASAVYSAVTGTGGSGGSFTVVHRIPVEVAQRTAIGALQNQDTQDPFVLSLSLNASGKIYSTSPTTLPSVSTKVRLLGYWKTKQSAYAPTPQAFGTTQLWNRSTETALNGQMQFNLPSTGRGGDFRTIAFLNYATGSDRSGSDFPDPFTLNFRGLPLFQVSQLFWQDQMSREFNLTSSTLDSAGGLDTGVFVWPFATDFGLGVGADTGLGYLSTNPGDEIEVIGDWGASSTLYYLVNWLNTKGPLTSIQGR